MTAQSHSDVSKTTQDDQPTLYNAVSSAVYRLGHDVNEAANQKSGAARATLSRLRRAAGTAPGDDPIAWGLATEELLPNLPAHEIGRSDEPSHGEWAAFTALAMFAIHQQSQSSLMHRPSASIGSAVGELKIASNSESIKARLDALQTAQSKKAIQYHLRSIINLLNSYDIPLDYGLVALDLKKLLIPKQRPGVVIRWGRDYVRALHPAS